MKRMGLLALLCAALFIGIPGQPQDKSPRIIRMTLNAPNLTSPTVPFAILDYDPLPKFSAALGEMRASFQEQLSCAPDSEQLEIIRNAQMLVAWNSLFSDIQHKVVALSPHEVPRLHISFSNPSSPKWIVSMTVILKGEAHPVCWSLPIMAETEGIVPMEFNENNYLRLEPIYNSIMAASSEKI